MKLARKMTWGLLAVAIVLSAGQAAFQSWRESRGVMADMKNDQLLLGHGLAGAIAKARDTWHEDGEATALELLREAGGQEGGIALKWRWLSDFPGLGITPEEVAVLKAGGDVTTQRHRGRDGQLVTLVPVLRGRRAGAIELSKSLSSLQASIEVQVLVTVASAVGLVLVFFVVANWMGRRFVGRPVDELVALADRVGHGNFEKQATVSTNDELGVLAAHLNGMASALVKSREDLERENLARLAAQTDLAHAQRLLTVGKLAAGLAHELGTPLNVAASYSQMIHAGSIEGEEARMSAGIVAAQIDTVTRITRQLLDFARSQKPERSRQSLSELVAASVSLLHALVSKAQVRLALAATQSEPEVEVDGAQLHQVFANLIINAVHASPKEGQVEIEVGSKQAPAPSDIESRNTHWAVVTIKDHGSGVAAEALPHIFEPFFTTKPVGEGTGLGLAVAWGIVREHGGWIGVDSTVGQGSSFSVYLPQRG